MVMLRRLAAPFAAFAGDERRRANRACTPSDSGVGRSKAEDSGRGFLVSRGMLAQPARGRKLKPAVAGPGRLPSRSPFQKAEGVGLSDLCVTLTPGGLPQRWTRHKPTAFPASPGRHQEPAVIGGHELGPHRRPPPPRPTPETSLVAQQCVHTVKSRWSPTNK